MKKLLIPKKVSVCCRNCKESFHLFYTAFACSIYKSFITSHLDYADVIYDQLNSEYFCQNIESVQYNAMLAIRDASRGTSQEILYGELGLQSL